MVEILFKYGYTKAATGLAFHNGRGENANIHDNKADKVKIQKLRNIMGNFLEKMQPGDYTPSKMQFIHMFVIFHGTAYGAFVSREEYVNSDDRGGGYSVSSEINTINGNILLMELIRLGYYDKVLLVSEPRISLGDDISNFRNKEGKNAFDLINQLIEGRQKIDKSQVSLLKKLKRFLHIKSTNNRSEHTILENHKIEQGRYTLIDTILLPYSKGTEEESFSSDQKQYFLQKLSLAGINLNIIHSLLVDNIRFNLLLSKKNTQVGINW